MPTTRRGKRTSTQKEADETSTATPIIQEIEDQPALSALSPSQFSVLICMSLAFTHFVEIAKTITSINGMLQNGGVIASENVTSIPINATSWCARHFQNITEIQADFSNQEEIIAELGCTPSDLAILNLKYQTSIIRLALSVITTMLCWGNQPLLKSWTYAYAIFMMVTLGGLMMQAEYLKGTEKFSLIAMLALTLTSNRRGRQGRLKLDIDEGLFNLALFTLTVLMSIIISTFMIVEIEEVTTLTSEDVTPGGKALWYMTMVGEYSIIMIVSCFALFFFDEGRKRALLILMSFVTVYHAFVQIPSQKDFWIDARSRQSFVMVMFVSMLAGGLVPSFNKFVIKK